MKHKECKKCKEIKELNQFYRAGKAATCKSCTYEKHKLYVAANPDKVRAVKRKYDVKNRDILNEKSKCRTRWATNKRMLAMAKYRAKMKGVPFNLDLNDIVIPATCPVLGLKLCVSESGKQKDNSPSLDRIIPEKGYVKGNVMIISNRANVIKNCGTMEEHEKIINYIKFHILTLPEIYD